MVNYLLRKIFFSKAMRHIRKGYWLDGYYEGKRDYQYNELLKGLENK